MENKIQNPNHIHSLFLKTTGVSTDTRNIEKGSMFFALKGSNFDGNKYAEKAIEMGAAYAIVDNPRLSDVHDKIFYVDNSLKWLQILAKTHRNKFPKLPVIGITGSNGKTTTKELLNAVLSQKYNILYTEGNLNNHIGVPLTLLKLNKSHQIAIIEMGANHVGEIKELCNIAEPNHGLITSIGEAHLEGFGSLENIIKTKKKLYRSVKRANGLIFINTDNTILMNQLPKNSNVFEYSSNTSKHFSISDVKSDPFLNFHWNAFDMNFHLKTNLAGIFNLDNVSSAIAVGLHFEISPEKINNALKNYIPQNYRSQVKQTEQNTVIIDAYNANPSSMSLAIDSFAEQEFDQKLLILGDMLELGNFETEAHEKILHKIQHFKIDAVFIGNIFFSFKPKFPEFQFYRNTEDFSAEKPNVRNKHILLKGSRGIKLEKLLDIL